MRKMKDRPLKDLYDLTAEILEPEITPVLKGLFRMQGPMDETTNDLPSDLVESQSKETIGRYVLNENLHVQAVSGTCNVCSAPCSSCMHHNSTVSAMESNIDVACPRGALKKEEDNFSCTNDKVASHHKTRVCDEQPHEASEGSNFFSTSSSRDSISENVESKISGRMSDRCDAYEDVNMLLDVSLNENIGVDEMLIKATEPQKIASKCPLLPETCGTSESLSTTIFVQDEEKQVLQNHEGNMSCVSCGKCADVTTDNVDLDGKNMPCSSTLTSDLAKTSKKTLQSQTSRQEKAGSETTSRKLLECANEFLKKYPSSSLAHSGIINKSDLPASLHMNINSSPRTQSPLLSLVRTSSCGVDLKDMKANTSFQHQEEPVGTSMVQRESNVVDPSVVKTIDGRKSIASDSVGVLPHNGDRKLNPREKESSSGNTSGIQRRVKSVDADDVLVKPEALKEENGVSINLEEPTMCEPSTETSPKNNIESENLEDVKVCDICGDAGREDLLAICSRCSDGAEHTYCMLVMMDKLPEGDWLCEECKSKEDADNRKMGKSKMACGMSKQPSFNKGRQDYGITLNPKDLPKLDNKSSAATPVVKEPQNVPTAGKKFSDNVVAISTSTRKPFEIGPSVMSSGTASPKLKAALSRESSFKCLDVMKTKPDEGSLPSGNHSTNNSQNSSYAPTSTGPASLNIQVRHHSPRGPFSKLSSDNLKPKVKHIIDNIPQKTKLLNEHTRVDAKKGIVRLMGKSTSFKGTRSGRPSIDLTCKTQHINRADDPRSMTQNSLERKHSFAADRHHVSSSSLAVTSISSKKELKAGRHDEKFNGLSEAHLPSASKGPEDARGLVGLNEVKQQKSYAEKNSQPNGAATSEDQKSCRKDTRTSITDKAREPVQHSQSFLSAGHDVKSKFVSVGNTRQVVSGGNKVLKCQKCNKSGHATQSCSIDKIQLTALKPSGERNSINKSSKWKETVKAAISMTRIHTNNNSSEQPNRLPLSSVNLKSMTSNANKTAVQDDAERQSLLPTEAACVFKSDDLVDADALRTEPLMQVVPEKAFTGSSFVRLLAIPENDYIWKGGFEVHRNGSFGNLYDGVQAHLSTRASPRVLEVATSFPCKVQLEELSCINVWPSQFQRDAPTEKDIALFFFATDIESYEANYKKLLENLMNNNLALKGRLEGVELLIFPSKKLPERSQSWNGLFFLWGVFRAQKSNCSESVPDFQTKLHEPNYYAESAHQEIFSPLPDDVCILQQVNSCLPVENELSVCDGQIKTDAAKSSTSMNSKQMVSSRPEERTFNLNEDIFDDENVHEAALHDNLLSEKQPILSFSESTLLTRNKQINMTGICSNPVPASNVECGSDMEDKPQDCDGKDNTVCLESIVPKEQVRWDAKPNMKRTHSHSPGPLPQATGGTFSEANVGKEPKKVKLYHEEHSCGNVMILPGSSQASERLFFPVGLSSLSESKPGIFVSLPKVSLNDDVEGPPELDVLNLELGLGADKQAERKKILPLFFDINNNETTLPSPVLQGNDCPASLSLSLAFPSPEVENQTGKKEQLLPQQRSNSFLFGSIIDRREH